MTNKLPKAIADICNALPSGAAQQLEKAVTRLASENASLRAALRWAYDRLDIDGGMTLAEQRRTVEQIGNTLAGQPSRASDYRPDSDEASMRREKGQWPT